jgi:hypothetical protein
MGVTPLMSPVTREALMIGHGFDRQHAVILALGWLVALWATLA